LDAFKTLAQVTKLGKKTIKLCFPESNQTGKMPDATVLLRLVYLDCPWNYPGDNTRKKTDILPLGPVHTAGWLSGRRIRGPAMSTFLPVAIS
jgi:hypothetical protein